MPIVAKGSTDTPAVGAGSFSAEEVGHFFGALASARDQFGSVTKELAREYGLGPRGPWMVGLIGRQTLLPNELASFFSIGRSLITSELRQLHDAGLIHYAKSGQDGRKVELSLTRSGKVVRDRLSAELARMLQTRLVGRSREEVMSCAQLLSDFAQGNQYAPVPRDAGVAPPNASQPDAVKITRRG